MVLFSITVYVLFHFGLDRDSLDGELASGVLSVTMLLAAVIGVTRLFAAEREQGGIDGLLLAPVDRTVAVRGEGDRAVPVPHGGSSWWRCRRSRCCCSARASTGRFPELLAILALGNLGVAAVGALVAALAAETRARELIVPLLLLPLLVPLLIACAQATRAADAPGRRPGGPRPLAFGPHSLRCGVRASLDAVFDFLLED